MEIEARGIRPGGVRLDEAGVTQHGLFRRRTLAWHEIEDYRLEIRHAPGAPGVFYLVDVLGGFLALRDARDAMRGSHRLAFGLELRGAGRAISFDDRRHRDAAAAIRQVLARIAAPFAERASARMAADGLVAFGPLSLAEHAVKWNGRDPLPREAVESIELFDATPATLRVMKRGKVLPYGATRTRAVPDLCAALDIAASLGYPVRGRELVAPVMA